jgi:protein associated with RNAse G/E
VSDDVRVVFRKYDGSLHWHGTLRRLGEDEHGTWLHGPVGTLWRRGNHAPIQYAHAHTCLVPRDAWWAANFNAAPAKLSIYVDVSTVATWTTPDEVTMIDLDLDVIKVRETGEVRIVDEDEFAAHQLMYSYPPEIVTAARQAADWLAGALMTTEPFIQAYHHWVEAAGAGQ